MSDAMTIEDHKRVGADFISQKRPRFDADHAAAVADHVFKSMHAFYGTLWMSKFVTGSDSGAGDDGVISAKRLWGVALSRYSPDVIRLALGKCITAHSDYPPNLPQFVALCEASRPREAYRPPANAIGMSQELRSSYSRRLREVNAKHLQRARDRLAGGSGRDADDTTAGVPVLHRLIAEAQGLAGGNEAAALRRLEVRNAPPR